MILVACQEFCFSREWLSLSICWLTMWPQPGQFVFLSQFCHVHNKMTNAYTTGGFQLTKKNISKLQVRSSVFLFFLLVQRNVGLKYASTIFETLSLPYPSFTFGFLRQARGSKMWCHKCEKTNTQGITHQTPPQNGVGVDWVCNTRLTMCCRNGISIGKKMHHLFFF